MNKDISSKSLTPLNLSEFLLNMGCTAETSMIAEKLTKTSGARYTMIWNSLTRRVQPSNVIFKKRLQVFCDDMKKYSEIKHGEKKIYRIPPKPLTDWQNYNEVMNQCTDAELKRGQIKQELQQINEKVSAKLLRRELMQRAVEDVKRRAWFLQLVCDDLKTNSAHWLEAKSNVEGLCCNQYIDVQSILNKHLPQQPNNSSGLLTPSIGNPVANSTIMSTHKVETVQCSGKAAILYLMQQRAVFEAFPETFPELGQVDKSLPNQQTDRLNTETAMLIYKLNLEVLKNRFMLIRMKKQIQDTILKLNSQLSPGECEHLTDVCVRAREQRTTREWETLTGDVTSRTGYFVTDDVKDDKPIMHEIVRAHKIIMKREAELDVLTNNMINTERKIMTLHTCLLSIFEYYNKDEPLADNLILKELELDNNLPQGSLVSLRKYFEETVDNHKQMMNVSLNLDISNVSCDDSDTNNPTFVDELKFYISNKFPLEQNRTIVTKGGNKVWISETLRSSLYRLYSDIQKNNLSCLDVCPSVSFTANLRRVIFNKESIKVLENLVNRIQHHERKTFDIDISSILNIEETMTDKIMKSLHSTMSVHQNISRYVNMAQENLRFWSENQLKNYISPHRKVAGRTYKEYESEYLDDLNMYNQCLKISGK